MIAHSEEITLNQLLFASTFFCDLLAINWKLVRDDYLSRVNFMLLYQPNEKSWFAAINFRDDEDIANLAKPWISQTSRNFLARE